MKNSELIKHIESKYDVKSIRYKSLSLWLEIRIRILILINLGQESTLKVNASTYKTILLTSFYGFFNWFKSYEAWVFSSKINRLKIDGKYHDRLYEYIGSKFNKTLFIEVTTDKHFKRKNVASKYIVSKSAFILLEKIISLFISTKHIDKSVIAKINKDYNIKYDANYAIKKMISQYKIMRFVLRFKKPKVVFLSPAYTAYGYVKAFKEKGIKVIEVQHGVILKEHFGYNVYEKFDDSYFVDYLLTFGGQEVEVFKESVNITADKVIPAGNYYLDYISNHYEPDTKLESILKNYKKSFVVSLQEIDKTDRLIPDIINCAKQNTDCVFILKPRKLLAKTLEQKHGKLDNVIYIDDINIYQLIMQTNFHITVYSTCAIEAPALGKQNILYNIGNLSKSIFENTLSNPITTTYVNDLNELTNLVHNIEPNKTAEILLAHKSVIKSNYKQNIDRFLKQTDLTNE